MKHKLIGKLQEHGNQLVRESGYAYDSGELTPGLALQKMIGLIETKKLMNIIEEEYKIVEEDVK